MGLWLAIIMESHGSSAALNGQWCAVRIRKKTSRRGYGHGA